MRPMLKTRLATAAALALAIAAATPALAPAQSWALGGPLPIPQHATATPQDWDSSQWTTAYAGTSLNLTGFTTIFTDSFTGGTGCPEIGPETFANDPNTAHILWYAASGGMGGAAGGVWGDNLDCSGGSLRMYLSYNGTNWQGPMISTANYDGNGTSLALGYFEATVTLPTQIAGLSPWFSPWVNGRFATSPIPNAFTEMDFPETGLRSATDPTQLVSTFHQWPATTPPAGQINAHRFDGFNWTRNVNDGNPHAFGLKITHDWVIEYLDSVEIARRPVKASDQRLAQIFHLDLAVNFVPTAATSTVYSITVTNMRMLAPPAGSCSVVGGC